MFGGPTIDRDFEVRLRVAMALSQKFWPVHVSALLEAFGSLSEALEADPKVFNAVKGLRGKREAWREFVDSPAVEREIAACAESNTQLIICEDAAYPRLLKEIPDPPLLLWVRGEYLPGDERAIAMVGSRAASHYALHQTRVFADGLAGGGVTIVSGLARGIDTEAHERSLHAGGRTIAVIGSGFSALYPKENRGLAKRIAESGALFTEFPLATKALPSNFPRRNRIVSGLSQGVLLVQAGERSGSLITARLANEQNREVFALPARLDEDGNEGGLKLIRDSAAALVTSYRDIFEALPSLGVVRAEAKPEALAALLENPEEAAICALLNHSEPTNIEEIIAAIALDAPAISSTLLLLGMRGVVKQLPGNSYLLAD